MCIYDPIRGIALPSAGYLRSQYAFPMCFAPLMAKQSHGYPGRARWAALGGLECSSVVQTLSPASQPVLKAA